MNSTNNSAATQHATDLRKKVVTLGHDAQEIGKITKDIAADTFEKIKENTASYYHLSQKKVQNLEKTLESQIQNHPLESMLIAAGLGLVLGAWLGRQSRSI